MSAIYGHRWVSAYGLHVDDAGKMSAAAEMWALGLSGLSRRQLQLGFEALLRKSQEWPPTLPEFRGLCLTAGVDVPSLDEAVHVLVNASSRQGSLAERYRHPLMLAIARAVDMFALRQASLDRASAMVRPVYERLVADGFPDWPDHAHEFLKALSCEANVDRDAGLRGIRQLREVLGG